MWAISIHHTIINSATAPGLYCTIKRSFFSSKALPNKFSGYRPVLTYTLQIVTSDNMVMEKHIGLIYNSIVCCSIWNYVIALVMQEGNSNSARLRLTLLKVSCLHYLRN